MSWCRARLMVPYILKGVILSGFGHPVWMKGILVFARAEFVVFVDVVLPRALFAVGLALCSQGMRFL